MRSFTRRKGAIGAVLALVLASAGVLLAASPAGAVVFQNGCSNSLTPTNTQLETTVTGTAPPSVTPGGSVTLSSINLGLFLPGGIFVTGYNAGILNDGDVVPANLRMVIEATSTVEGAQSTAVVTTSVGPINITDPDGIRATGDETADPAAVNVAFPDLTWTAGASGTILFREDTVTPLGANVGGLVVNATVGVLTVQFRCSPGTVDVATNVITFIDPAPEFAMTQIETLPVPPVAADDTATVAAGQSVSINVVGNDTDDNGDLDPSTVAIVSGPSAGTAVPNSDGTVTYTNTNLAATSDSFTYTVNDLDPTTPASNVATVTITITPPVVNQLDQIVRVQVIGADLTLTQAGNLVTLGSITLNGQPQTTTGALNGLTVLNARGTDPGWSLTGEMTTDFSEGAVVPARVCPASDPSTWDNHCIPGDNLGWTPSARVAHVQIPGDVAQVTAGSPIAPHSPGLGSAQALCSSPAKHSGGTFECGGGVALAIPASAAAGTYNGTLTLTLV